MGHRKNLDAWLQYCKDSGIPSTSAKQPMDALLQKIGIDRAPILFWPFIPAALTIGAYFAITWGLMMYVILWRKQEASLTHMLAGSIGAGAMFGIWMAWHFSKTRRKYGLSTWEQFVAGLPNTKID